MDPETIRAIGSLWLLALIVLLLVFSLLFRKPLYAMLERLTRLELSRGSTKVLVTKEPEETRPPEEEAQNSEAPPTAEIPTSETQAAESLPKKSLTMELLDAFSARRIEDAAALFSQMQEETDEPLQKQRNELIYLSFRYSFAADTSALQRMEELSQIEELRSDGYRWIGFAYEEAGDHTRAAEFFELAAKGHGDEDPRARATATVSSSRSLIRGGRKKEAIEKLMDLLGVETSPEAKADLYQGIAWIHEQSGDWLPRAFALEKALEFRPNDTSLRFAAAYSYGQTEFKSLALLHYRILLSFTPNDSMANNNMGVEYDRLQMPRRSVAKYKRAAELGNTLGMANLAYKYLPVGFGEEAETILARARELENPHPNVGRAMASLADGEDSEREKEQEVLREARQVSEFLREFSEAYFAKGDADISGQWRFSNGGETTADVSNGTLTIEWEDSRSKKYRITGRVQNRGAIVETQRSRPESLGGGYEKDVDGYIYASREGGDLRLLEMRPIPSITQLSKVT